MKNRLKRIICLHTFIERVIHSMSCTMHGFAHVLGVISFATCFELLLIDFHRVESTRVGTSRDDPVES